MCILYCVNSLKFICNVSRNKWCIRPFCSDREMYVFLILYIEFYIKLCLLLFVALGKKNIKNKKNCFLNEIESVFVLHLIIKYPIGSLVYSKRKLCILILCVFCVSRLGVLCWFP